MKLFKHSWQKSSTFFFVLLFASFLIAPSVFAQSTQANACTCFCGNSVNGAYSADGQAEFSSTQDECMTTCKDVGEVFVGCYAAKEQYPGKNNLCWTQKQCDGFTQNRAGKTIGADFGGQSPYCMREAGSGATTGYCYSDPLPVTLNVPILGTAEVSNLATYVNLIYTWLLPAGAIMAVVMVMIAGLQYATAAGNAGQVSQAKDRIFQALMGLVLLMAAYTILRFISPDLVRLDLARVPMIREADIVDPSLSCEVLKAQYGFTIAPSAGQSCGNTGTIQAIPEEVNTMTWKVGDECKYATCSDPGTACVTAPDGTGKCISCDNAAGVWGDISPSQAVCDSIEQTLFQLDKKNQQTTDPGEQNQYMCEYSSAFVQLGAKCVAVYSDTSTKALNCSVLRDQAEKMPDNPCGVYDSVQIAPGDGFAVSVTYSNMYDLIDDVCSSDPCGVSPAKGCQMHPATQTFIEGAITSAIYYTPGYQVYDWLTGGSEYIDEGTVYNACIIKE